MNGPFPAYKGPEPYTFVCYAHRDSDTVFADLAALHGNGIHLWYDEGISAGASWRAEIATAIKGASRLLFFISEASLASSHCLREVDYALTHDIEIVPVYVDDSALPGELELALNRVQALFRATDSMYLPHLESALHQSAPVAPLLPLAGKRRLRLAIPVLVLGVLLILAVWWQWDTRLATTPRTQSVDTGPNAFDLYLEGLGLMARWDQPGNLDKAIDLFHEASIIDPEFALAFAREGEALRIRFALTGDQQWLDAAMKTANTALSLNPDLAPVQVTLGRIYTTMGNVDLAFAALKRALAIDANDAVANESIASVYERLGRLEDAESAFQRAVALDPDRFSILNAYANFLYRQSRYGEAIKQWQAVVRIVPDHYAAVVNLGTVLSETGRIAEAITMYERAIKIRPTYMAYSNLGTAYSRARRYPDAVAAYQQALGIDDADWLAWGNLAYVYSWMTQKEKEASAAFSRAIELAEKARRASPRDPFVHSDLALYYAKTHQPELAIQRANAAVALSPNSGEILAAAAEAHELIGERDQAIQLALKSLDFGYTRQHFQRNPELADLLSDARMQQ